ncbi:MAG: alkaline phosphatase D family protein [Panacagrimonas sp.]
MNSPIFSDSRRRLLHAGASSLLLPACAQRIARPARSFANDPFSLGVASGEPQADGFVIWTRLAPDPLADESGAGGMPPEAVAVEWLIAEDEQLRKPVREGIALAEPAWAHSVHVEIEGLKPDRPYWYAFRVGSWQSRIGRARTTPKLGAAVASLRLAFASCQHFETGFYAAYRHMVADNPDLILHLGDYLYEGSSNQPVRRHESASEPRTLADYRRRHACYKRDPDLQAAHAHAPWLMTWDDHEVDNDYAGIHPSEPAETAETFRSRRAAAYRAYWEHMPLRLRARPAAQDMALFTVCDYGALLRIQMLDTRQYRSDQACGSAQRLGGQVIANCAERLDPARQMLGPAQEQWLLHGLDQSRAQWNVIAQTLLMAPLDQHPGPGEAHWSDGWDGYPAARERILNFIAQRRPSNPVVLGGDIHSFWATELSALHGTAPVATEFVGTSISSPGISHEAVTAMRPDNPHVKFCDARFRGYVRCDVSPAGWRTDFRVVADVRDPASAASTLASFQVENGRAGPISA